ncbi:MAG: alpha/beta fold hydrolase [Dehalococcoidia bacterium]
MDLPAIRFTETSDGASIAYYAVGSGPTLINPPGWVSHLQNDWENGNGRQVAEELADRYTLVRYDKRGTGLSDRSNIDVSTEAQVRDLEAVIEATGSERVGIRASSGAGPAVLLYAARNPEQVLCLALYGRFAAGGPFAKRLQMVRFRICECPTAGWLTRRSGVRIPPPLPSIESERPPATGASRRVWGICLGMRARHVLSD